MSTLAALVGRVQAMVSRATVAAVDDGPQIQELQIELLDEETQDKIEHVQPYGFASHPNAGAEAVPLAVGGLKSHLVAIVVSDRRYRLKVEQGEVAIHDDQGQKVHLTRDGIVITAKKITMESEGDISFDATGNFSVNAADFTVEASGDAVIAASGNAELDGAAIAIGAGASLKAARDTDPINDSTHKISGGSSKVKIA